MSNAIKTNGVDTAEAAQVKMPATLKAYLTTIIGAAAIVLGAALLHWSCPHLWPFVLSVTLAILASMLKMRLPGVSGTYSVSFIFILSGIVYFSLPETLVIACVTALVQSLFNTKKRPTIIQVLFNIANLTLSVGACFLVAHTLLNLPGGNHQPAALALIACVFFVTNTVLVSGVLSLLQGSPLAQVCQEWYLWSLPYYLIGAALVGLLPVSGRHLDPTSWLILLPPLYLLHFYYGLLLQPQGAENQNDPGGKAAAKANGLPVRAQVYVYTVIAGGLMLASWAATHWNDEAMLRFFCYFAVTLLTSTCKVRLPRMTSTISLNFVVILAAIAQLPLAEIILISGAAAIMQCLWKPQRAPLPVQIFFSFGAIILSSTLAFVVCHAGRAPAAGNSWPPLLVVAAGVFYLTNSLMVAAVLCLIQGIPLYRIWQSCCFWSLPYYLVGAVFADLMIISSGVAEWQTSLLALPLMALVYVSYRLHIKKAVLCVST